MASNVIPFPTARAKNREEIDHLTAWREQIYGNYPTMTEIGKAMADVILARITEDLASLGVPNEGRAA